MKTMEYQCHPSQGHTAVHSPMSVIGYKQTQLVPASHVCFPLNGGPTSHYW